MLCFGFHCTVCVMDECVIRSCPLKKEQLDVVDGEAGVFEAMSSVSIWIFFVLVFSLIGNLQCQLEKLHRFPRNH